MTADRQFEFGPRGPQGRRLNPRGLRAPLIAILVCLLATACGRDPKGRESIAQPLGDMSRLRALLDAAMRRADPQGAVLVVLWTTEQPPSRELERIAKEWNRYGLIPIGVCLDLAAASEPATGSPDASGAAGSPAATGPDSDTREAAIARVRSWERSHKGGIRGMILDGPPEGLAGFLGLSRPVPAVSLLSAQGAVLWSREGFGGLDELEKTLNVHLGQPPLALGECGVPVPKALPRPI